MQNIPLKMWAVVQSAVGAKLEIKEMEVPKPEKGQVLIKMEFASINPSDLSLLKGTYASKASYPFVPGIEGSGRVVAKGEGLMPAIRMGKRVSCTSTAPLDGCWAEYMLTSAMHVIPIANDINYQQASAMIVNPLTAIAFMDIASTLNIKSIANNAAGGALGKMMVRLSLKFGFDLISIVRNNAQKENLKSLGAKYVLDSSDANYTSQLKDLTHQLDTKLYFDAIGGQSTYEFIEASPESSFIYLYANLSGEKVQFEARTLLQQNKEIRGFFLGQYSAKQNLVKTLKTIKKAQKLIHQELQTQVVKSFSLNEVQDAIDLYEGSMSAGKVLLNCGGGLS